MVFKIQDDAPRTAGWLRKKGKRLKMWTRRWCVIDWEEYSDKAVVACYDKDDVTVVPHTVIPLECCAVHARPDLDETDAKGGAYAFSIDTAPAGRMGGGPGGEGVGGGGRGGSGGKEGEGRLV